MADAPERAASPTAHGNHFSCSLTAVLIARVQAFGGDPAVAELLKIAGSERSVEYLLDTSNWVAYDEALAMLRAGALVTHHPNFAYAVGEDSARRLSASPVASLLRSLGSPEAVYRQIAMSASKFSTIAKLDMVNGGPGFAEIASGSLGGFHRSLEHCAWTRGLLATAPILFEMEPAVVQHDECSALGAPVCVYRIRWDIDRATASADGSGRLTALRQQLDAMKERLDSMFATASDLIGSDDIDQVLARITQRAGLEVRAPRYLLAVRLTEGGEVHCHHKGFEEDQVSAYADRILDVHAAEHPQSWLVAPVRSNRRDYGRLLAMNETEQPFFPQERELLQVYARYAASALDGATSLMEAQRRYDQSSALLQLARALATAGTSGEVARRLADAVPEVVDCDRAGVYLWDSARGELVRRAVARPGTTEPVETPEWSVGLVEGGLIERLLSDPAAEPIFVDADTGEASLRELLAQVGALATILVPIATPDSFLGLLAVSVLDRAERMKPTPDLVNRLSGVAAQATTALQNGKLVDQITHQALHDQLTGLANRLQLADKIRSAVARARQDAGSVTLFYVDLDWFKPVNDEFGHGVGDSVLSAVGQRLSSSTRSTDVVARLGGDEFAVLLDGQTSPQEADVVEERLGQAFAAPFAIDSLQLRLGASVGRAVFPIDADSADALLRSADAAMFEVKRARSEARTQLTRGR
jgi:diguanylate cyclase (GGDEF)-like protein